ncbi:hypothetical protein MMC30_005052 [Trapelia coarctata]|nr:hypothetical protein [Trapelia coarctata]
MLSLPFSDGGVIDPSGFQDHDGRQYIVYKLDGNGIGNGGSCGNTVAPIKPTPIMQVAAANGYDLIDGPKQILDRDDHDGPLVEAPSLIRVQNKDANGGWMYVLFISSHFYSGRQYDTRYATSMHGLFNNGHNYRKADKPLLETGDHEGKLYSPGGMQVSSNGSSVVFHADKDQSSKVRRMWKGRIEVNGREVNI